MKTHTKIFITCFLIIICYGCFVLWYFYTTSQEDISLEYDLWLKTDNSTIIETYIPIPQIPHKIIIRNNITDLNIINTEHGKMYYIKGSNNLHIRMEGHQERHKLIQDPYPDTYYGFSSQLDSNKDNITTWRDDFDLFLYNKNNDELNCSFFINIHSSKDHICSTSRYNSYSGNLTPSWNLLNFKENGISGDSFGFLWPWAFCSLPTVIIVVIILCIWGFALIIKEKIKRKK